MGGNYKKIYCDYFGYGEHDIIKSEISNKPAHDIHHIDSRGMGGSNKKDIIENLMALTREEHIKYGDKKKYKPILKSIHKEFMRKYKSK